VTRRSFAPCAGRMKARTRRCPSRSTRRRRGDLTSGEFNLIGGTAWAVGPTKRCVNAPSTSCSWTKRGSSPWPTPWASTNGSRNMLLLGDPLQLSQVAKAEHPGGSGSSVLQHVLG